LARGTGKAGGVGAIILSNKKTPLRNNNNKNNNIIKTDLTFENMYNEYGYE